MDESKVVELYKEGKSSYQISDLLGIPPTSVRRVLSKFSIKGRSNKTPDEIEEKIIISYKDGNSSEKIAKELNINGTTVCRILKRNGISIRNNTDRHKKYEINEDFFDIIDSQEKAYILGFMYADGNVHSKYPSIKIELHEKDIDILYKIQNCLFNGNKSKIGVDKKIYRYINVTSLKLKNDLIKHGCMPNKTFKAMMPNLSEDLISHFLRGLYDGDGCISTASENVRVILTGSNLLLEGVGKVITSMTGIIPSLRMTKGKPNISDLSITNRYDCVKFLNWLYKDSTIYLERKFNYYHQSLDICKPKTKYGSVNIVSYNGQKLTSKYIKSLSINEKENVSKFLFEYFRQNGFPYELYFNSELLEDFKKLIDYNPDNSEFKFPDCGLKIFKHFCPHFYEVSGNKLISMLDCFNNDSSLMAVIKNRLGITYKETFNITGNMIRQGIRNSHNGFAASTFKPSLAKSIYDEFCPEDGIVLDISAGFGQRMLGAMASKKVSKYIGIDPWSKQIEAISKMRDFFGFGDKVELYQDGSELFCPENLISQIDFCFSSPPFFDKEIYCNELSQAYYGKKNVEFLDSWWKETYNNVYKLLKSGSLFVLNMNKSIADIMIVMCKDKFELIDTKKILYRRSHLPKDAFDYFFVLRKI